LLLCGGDPRRDKQSHGSQVCSRKFRPKDKRAKTAAT
jgi:hypothetical protein